MALGSPLVAARAAPLRASLIAAGLGAPLTPGSLGARLEGYGYLSAAIFTEASLAAVLAGAGSLSGTVSTQASQEILLAAILAGAGSLTGALATPSQGFAFTDNFDGSDTALGERPLWTRAGGVSGGCATRSGKLSHFVSGGSDTAYYVETGYAKHKISGEIQQAANSTTLLIAGRIVDNSNYVALRRNSNQWQLYKVINGGFTMLGSSSQAVAVGDVVEISFEGDTVSVKRNGAEMVGTGIVMNAPTLLEATKAGTVARTTFDPALDNVSIVGNA